MSLPVNEFNEMSEAIGVRGALVEVNQRAHGVHDKAQGGASLVGHDDKQLSELQKKLDLESTVQKINFRRQEAYLYQEQTIQKIQRPGGFAYRYIVKVGQDNAEIRDLSEEEAKLLLREFPTLKLIFVMAKSRLPSWLGWWEKLQDSILKIVPVLGGDESTDLHFSIFIIGCGVFLVVTMAGLWLWLD